MKLDFEYDERSDTLKIEGIRYAGDVFREFGKYLAIGEVFVLLKREDGELTIRKVRFEKDLEVKP